MTSGERILRGQIWAVDLGLHEPGEKFHVVLSNNGRNASAYPWVHVARITARKPAVPLPTVIELPGDLPGGGWVKCDELMPLRKERLRRQVGVVPQAHIARIEDAIRLVLGLR
ncbi:MAG TPA: type II toxin-antitoxin system PemK/MazF family toxin [Streptosporangiaceae bacterium]|nr:type II toxin-antitoxin system PemK/MazF family toxin [Streptosporangiaceae bacterium]